MDVTSTLLGSIIISICVFPFVAVQIGTKKKKEHLKHALNQLAQNHQSQLSTMELFGDHAIGLDTTNQMVFFTKKNDEIALEEHVDLRLIDHCFAQTLSKTVSSGKEKREVVTQVELYFKPKNTGDNPSSFIFYSEDFNAQLGNEYPMAKKWAQILNDKLNK